MALWTLLIERVGLLLVVRRSIYRALASNESFPFLFMCKFVKKNGVIGTCFLYSRSLNLAKDPGELVKQATQVRM